MDIPSEVVKDRHSQEKTHILNNPVKILCCTFSFKRLHLCKGPSNTITSPQHSADEYNKVKQALQCRLHRTTVILSVVFIESYSCVSITEYLVLPRIEFPFFTVHQLWFFILKH